ncbi:MAG: cellulase family glycosylhydrolase [Phycisphaerae bacterium]
MRWVMLVACVVLAGSASALERVEVAKDAKGFVLAPSGKAFVPWGLNYGNNHRLIEDFWDAEWATVEGDWAEMKAMGANVVRVHLQFGKFMKSADRPSEKSLALLAKLLALSEKAGIYVDVTGLACYRKADVPGWYDSLSETDRWAAQAVFWRAVAKVGAKSNAVFCYDLMNEPITAGGKRAAGAWYSGKTLGEYDFIQVLSLDQGGRKREEVGRDWIRQMTKAIRAEDAKGLITVGLLPKVPKWGHMSGFDPKTTAAEVDFMCVHVYPETGKVAEALAMIKEFQVGKPLVIEETFNLSCGMPDLIEFIKGSRGTACGWVGHYDGHTVEDTDAFEKAGKMTMPQGVYREFLKWFRTGVPE